MYLTVGEVLALPPLRELSLVAGASGIDREVTRVSVLEVPLGYRRWSRGGELYMSSLYALRGQGAEAYVDSIDLVHEGAAAALCLHPGVTGFLFLDLMEQRAENLGLPLILLPADMPYCVVTDAVIGGLLGRQSALLERSAAINRELTQVILGGGGLDDICCIVARRMQRHVAVLGIGNNEIMAHSGLTSRESDPLGELFESHFSFAQAIPVPLPAALSSGGPRHIFTSTVETRSGPINLLAAPVVVGEEAAARLVIWGSDDPCSDLDLMILAHACTVVGLEVLKRRAVLEAERKIRRDFYGASLNGEFGSLIEAEHRARQAGVELRPTFLVAALAWGSLPPAHAMMELGQWAGSAAILHHGTLVFILPISLVSQCTLEDASVIVERVIGRVRPPGHRISAGLSGIADGVLQLPTALKEAQLALSVANRLKQSSRPLCYGELGVFQLLAAVPDSDLLQRFAQRSLAELLASHGGETLTDTLEAYLDACGSPQEAAKILRLHPNTVKYRMDNIRRVLDPQALDDPSRRIGLHVALKIRRLER